MNTPVDTPPPEAATEDSELLPSQPTSQFENFLRRHPALTALAAVGLGCALGVVARELLTPPPPPKHRALRLLEDIQEQLSDIARPAYSRASDIADSGVSAVKRGMHSVADSTLGHRLLHLFA